MKLDNVFTIDASAEEVWAMMLDLGGVAGCVPGSEVLGETQDGGLEANIRVKLGPMAMSFRGTVRIVDQDADARRAVMSARARESRGQGTANASMVMQVQEGPPVCVSIVTDLDVTGRAAQMGHGVIQDVARRIVDEFAKNLQARIAATEGIMEPATDPSLAVAQGAAGPVGETPPLCQLPLAAAGAQGLGGALKFRDLVLAVLGGRWRALVRWIRQAVAVPKR